MSKRRLSRSRDEWSVLVSAFYASSLSRARFCEQHSLSVGSLDKWCRIISAKPIAIAADSKLASGFIPIELKSEASIETEAVILSPLKISSGAISVEFAQGCKPVELRQVMELLHAH